VQEGFLSHPPMNNKRFRCGILYGAPLPRLVARK